MKIFWYYIGISWIFLSGCTSTSTVSLQFQNAQEEDILLFRPVNHHRMGVTDTIKSIKNDSLYHITLDIDRVNPLRIQFAGHLLSLLIEPGKQLSVLYDLKQNTCRISGNNAPGVELYNRQLTQKNPHLYERVRKIQYPLDSVPEKIDHYFRELQRKEIASYDSLYQLDQISEKFLNYVRNDIRLYYSMTLSKIAWNLSTRVNQEAFNKYLTRLYNEHPLREEDLNSDWIDEYAKAYLSYKEKSQPEITSLKEYYEYIYDTYNRQISNPRILERVLGRKIYLEALNNKTASLELLTCFDRFKNQFPDNPYTPFYAAFQREWEDFQEKIRRDFSPEVKFVEGYAGISSWEELTARFQGKPLFIDFWFSTCGPCREEFAYASLLEKFLKENGIELLYISVDNEGMEENWRNAIKYFDLKGWHVRTSYALQMDFAENLGIYSFPTYMLLDKKGNILLRNAKKPSEKGALYQQLTEALQ